MIPDENNPVSDTSRRRTPLGIERHFDRLGDWLDGSWAIRKVAPVLNNYPHAVKNITWIMRLCVGATFIISGVVKGIDPWGTYYKMQDYLLAMHIPLSEWGNTVLTLSFFLFSIEFVIGASLLTGCFRKATPILSALFMLVMLPLTLWIAIADPVADCGCFGDFFIISNWATFFKNVLLSLAIVWLLRFNREAKCLITPYLQWIAAVGMCAYILIVGLIGYRQQPMLDFRQYKVGTQLIAAEDMPEFIPTYEFVYEKDGEEKTFGENDELPDTSDGWKFVRRIEKDFVPAEDASDETALPAGDFRIWNEDASEDVTESLSGVDEQLILFSPDIKDLSMATSWKINRLYDMASENGVDFLAVASGNPREIEQWRDLSSGQYPIYTADDTSIKELVRGNPALVSLKNGKIMWKAALSSIVLDDFTTDIRSYPLKADITGRQAFECLTIILIGFLAIIALASQLKPLISLNS